MRWWTIFKELAALSSHGSRSRGWHEVSQAAKARSRGVSQHMWFWLQLEERARLPLRERHLCILSFLSLEMSRRFHVQIDSHCSFYHIFAGAARLSLSSKGIVNPCLMFGRAKGHHLFIPLSTGTCILPLHLFSTTPQSSGAVPILPIFFFQLHLAGTTSLSELSKQ